jgi:hypothetical protein
MCGFNGKPKTKMFIHLLPNYKVGSSHALFQHNKRMKLIPFHNHKWFVVGVAMHVSTCCDLETQERNPHHLPPSKSLFIIDQNKRAF